MDFFLDGTKGLGLIGRQTVAMTKGTLAISNNGSGGGGNDAVQQSIESSKSEAPSAERAGRFLTLSQIHSAISIANDALTEIGTLREKQVAIAEEASSLATGQRTTDLQTENDAIETRIQQITSAARYNGRSVLSRTTYGAEVSSAGLYDAIAVPDASSVTASWGLSFSSQPTSQSDFMSAVYEKQSAFESIYTAYGNALAKSADVLQNTLVEAAKAPDSLRTEKTATQLATDIAYQIGSEFSSEEATRQLIDISFGKADTEKSFKLLLEPELILNISG